MRACELAVEGYGGVQGKGMKWRRLQSRGVDESSSRNGNETSTSFKNKRRVSALMRGEGKKEEIKTHDKTFLA